MEQEQGIQSAQPTHGGRTERPSTNRPSLVISKPAQQAMRETGKRLSHCFNQRKDNTIIERLSHCLFFLFPPKPALGSQIDQGLIQSQSLWLSAAKQGRLRRPCFTPQPTGLTMEHYVSKQKGTHTKGASGLSPNRQQNRVDRTNDDYSTYLVFSHRVLL